MERCNRPGGSDLEQRPVVQKAAVHRSSVELPVGTLDQRGYWVASGILAAEAIKCRERLSRKSEYHRRMQRGQDA